MFDDLENMLGGPNPGPKVESKSGARLNKRASNTKIVPISDVDDLEDMYNFESKTAARNPASAQSSA